MVIRVIHLSIPDEIDSKFKNESNKSGLIRDLLDKHYGTSRIKGMNREQLLELKEDIKKKKELKKQIEEINVKWK